MRVIAGTARGRRLSAPAGTDVRPTSDRVREAVFNALGSLGAVDGARALDLFAGSGALGIEALSRGAAHVTFVEQERSALTAVEANVAVAGVADRAMVVRGDAVRLVATALSGPFDLALCDPPYTFDRWDDLLAGLLPLLATEAVVVTESGRPVEPGAAWEMLRQKRYGGTVVSILRPLGNPPGAPS
ncbi:16S rRNA (guanine(966)-N(2))-methyltransferase RsmD [soil metagenome]